MNPEHLVGCNSTRYRGKSPASLVWGLQEGYAFAPFGGGRGLNTRVEDAVWGRFSPLSG